jgi:hypothetical protein
VVTVAMNLMLGAAVLTRSNWLKTQGLQLPADAQHYRPLELDAISTLLQP